MIGLINLEVKCAGARSAGNPHAACDVEGVGNGPYGYRASSRPYQESAMIAFVTESL